MIRVQPCVPDPVSRLPPVSFNRSNTIHPNRATTEPNVVEIWRTNCEAEPGYRCFFTGIDRTKLLFAPTHAPGRDATLLVDRGSAAHS